jgi:hypothetical protein
MKLQLRMLISLLPAAMAEFDNCDLANSKWIGFDQADGQSRGYGATYHAGNVYAAGHALKNFSFGTKHMDGTYNDHAGASTPNHHDTTDTVLTSHNTGWASSPRVGMHMIISKTSEAGVPSPQVFAADLIPHGKEVDGKTSTRVYGWMQGVAGFPGAANDHKIAAIASHCGDLSVPLADGTNELLENPKFSSWDYNGAVMKVDMATGKADWATNTGLTGPEGRQYALDVAVTASGDVIVTGNLRNGAGRLAKYDGATGTMAWMVEFEEVTEMRLKVVGETAYVTGTFTGTGITNLGSTLISCQNGESESALVASLDVSTTTAPTTAKWVKLIGCGEGADVTVTGDSLYVAGELDQEAVASALAPATGVASATCTMAGDKDGYLAKLNQADGTCVWAKDAAKAKRLVTDGTHVWTGTSTSSVVHFSDTLSMMPGADSNQVFAAKYDAADGTGLWADRIGGNGDSQLKAMVITEAGPVFVGYTESHSIEIGDLKANNLQHQRSDKSNPDGQAGDQSLLMIQLSKTDKLTTSCVTSCPSGKIDANTVIAPGFCLVAGSCLAEGAGAVGDGCFQCQTAVSQFAVQGPVLDNHCYFDGKCHDAGSGAGYYTKYNSASVCEVCQPAVDTTGYTLAPNYFHDRAYAKAECWAATMGKGAHNMEPGPCAPNNFGILFTRNSGGCQELPDVPLPATPSAALAMALEVPTSGAVADVGARAIKAITETNTATTVDGTQLVSAWYHANQANCNGASGFEVDHDKDPATPKHKTGACKNTPAAHADEMASLFGTSMYYGHSVARIKVQQALAILDDDFKTGTVTAVKDDMKKDIVAHILVPMYQGAIKAAYDMDTASDKAAALAAGLAYWNLIHPNVPGFDAADKARLVALFGSSAASGTHNYCEVKAILHRNLPDGSMLQYGQQTHQTIGVGKGSQDRPLRHDSGLPTASLMHVPEVSGKDGNQPKPISGELGIRSETEATEGVHIKERDIGTLVAAVDGGGDPIVCTYPPPAPPPPVPSSPSKSDSDSGLTDGEIAGVAIGAAIGGIVLLGAVGLILRSIMFKEAKPVFTCLEKAPAKSPA